MKKKTIRINVTARDIALGIPGNNHACPINRAAKRVFRKSKYLGVGMSYLYVDTRKHGFALPEVAQNFIKSFDSDYSRGFVEPFSFTLTVG